MISTVSGQFDTTFTAGPLQPSPDGGTFQAEVTLAEQTLEAAWIGAAGRDPTGPDPSVMVQLLGTLPDGRLLFFSLQLPPAAIAPAVQPFYNFETVGFAAFVSPAQPNGLLLGFVNEGAVDFDAASLGAGDRVAGRFEGAIFHTSCFE